jgi:2-methylaconitate cis-trans-isomerase PrpF
VDSRVRAVLMRGGTSRALFFHHEDIPLDPEGRSQILLRALGSPDPYRRQVDGIGGATSSTSKAAIIRASELPDIDVEYTFGQVAIDRPLVDFSGSCGNIASAVGPFAVDEGLVRSSEPVTTVRILATNIQKVIVASVPTRAERFDSQGSFEIAGVPGTASEVVLDFLDPAGSRTRGLLPTGNPTDMLATPGQPDVEVSIVDASHPFVFCRFEDFGLTGAEDPASIESNLPLMRRLEEVRAHAGHLAGVAPSPMDITRSMPATPRLALVAGPRSYQRGDGPHTAMDDVDIVAQALSMGAVHRSYPLTGAICTAAAAAVPGSLVSSAAGGSDPSRLRIGHPSGIIEPSAEGVHRGGQWHVTRVKVGRTARRIMEGYVLIPDR